MPEIRAALRDAAFYGSARFAEVRAQPKYVPCYHVVNPDDPYLSRCGRLIVPETEVPATSVFHRCGRPGCKQGWPT